MTDPFRLLSLLLCGMASASLAATNVHAQTSTPVTFIGSEQMAGAMAEWDVLFAKQHPEISVTLLLKGSSTGISGLTAGVSALAPMSREASEVDLRPFRFVYGYLPADILVGRCGYAGPAKRRSTRVNPPAVYVHRTNPLAGLTAQQVASIFTAGNAQGDITQWSQLPVPVPSNLRAIHVYGPRDDGGFASSLRALHMGGHAFTLRYEPLPTAEAILQALAADPYGIAVLDEFPAARLPAQVRLLPLALNAGAPFSAGTYDDVARGAYPLSPWLHLYLNHAPGKPVSPWLLDYLRLALSDEGQRVLAAAQGTSSCVFPLSAAELAEQRRKLEQLAR